MAAGGTAPAATILIVEDDAAIRNALRMLLELEGYRVAAAASGQEALGLVEQGICRPALVLVDQNLPSDLSSVETVQHVRRLTEPQLPALVITGDVLPERLAALRAAGLPHLIKPVVIDELQALVRSLLGRGPGRGDGSAVSAAGSRRPDPKPRTRGRLRPGGT